MPRVKIKAGDQSEVKAAAGFSTYAGPEVPKGVYKCVVKVWNLMENSSGDHMFKILFVVDEPKTSKKAKYNGYEMWYQANLTEVGAPYANAMFDALAIPRKAVWGNGPVVDPDGDIEAKMGIAVTKLGTRSPIGLEVLVVTKPEKYKNVTSQKPGSFLTIPEGYGAADPDDDGSDDDDDEDSPMGSNSDDDDEDGKDSSDDDDGSDDDDDDSF